MRVSVSTTNIARGARQILSVRFLGSVRSSEGKTRTATGSEVGFDFTIPLTIGFGFRREALHFGSNPPIRTKPFQ